VINKPDLKPKVAKEIQTKIPLKNDSSKLNIKTDSETKNNLKLEVNK
jgi:hypothetical protein